jgi:Ca2+-binding EF-hand superfamily protein
VSRTAAEPTRVVLEGAEIEFALEDGLNNLRVAYGQQFDLADGDKNGYVDKEELMRVRANLFQQVFQAADRDGDGKLFKKELEAYVERQSDAVASRVMLTIADRGRALLEKLDTDGDEKLSLRELRRARECLAAFDRDGDGAIAQDEIPRHYRLGVGRGQAPIRRALVVDSYESADPPRRKAGPPWFEKMDRNRDGDVSLREFLGPRDVFRRFDADGDGLIDPREAAQAP